MINYIQKLSLLLTAILLLGVVDTAAQEKGKVKDKLIHAMTQERNSNGREFYVAFPYNDYKQQPTQNIAIYVTSSVNTKATITNEETGLNITKNVKAFEITEFSSVQGGLGWDAEIYDFQSPQNLGFKITAPDPVAVYCMNSKSVSSEGYLAIPINFWGKEYIHNSFYDFDEVREWAGGFVVLAQEDFTTVNMQLVDGANKVPGFGQTTKGNVHGDRLTVLLMKGEVYAVQGTGETRGMFDLSGSIISADKPVGLISYHNRTMIPATVVTSGRDHIIEMIPPIQAWGTEYATVEFDRKKDKGDYFRVVAGEDNVTFNINWWTKDGTERISTIGPITLQDKGDWFDYDNTGANAPHDLESIRGMSHFKADGPILVCQYSYSANYDGAGGNYDPFMIVTTAVEQYTKETVFQTPQNYGNNEFKNNFFNVIAIGDPDDGVRHQELLNSIMIDDQRVVDKSPSFLNNRIPETNLYWAFITDLEAGSHHIRGNTPFGGYIYGYASFDSYGWPAATAYGNLSEIDTLPPIVTFPPGCFEWTIHNVDDPEHERNGEDGDDPKQVDVGVRELPELLEGSFNFDDPVYVDEDGNEQEWSGINPNYDFYYKVKVTDPYQNGKAILRVKDDVGNITDTTIVYNVDQIIADPDPIVYGKVRVGTDKTLDVTITSGSEDPVEISEIKLRLGQVYTIDTDLSFVPFTLEPLGDTTLTITYSPIDEYTDLSTDPELQFDFDTLVVTTGCLEWEYALNGQGIQPEIIVEFYNAGQTQIGDFTLSNNNPVDNGVLITNNGTAPLTITGLKNVIPPFTLPNMPAANINGDEVTFDNPIIVPVDDGTGANTNEVLFGHQLDNKYLIRFEPTSTDNAVDNTIDVLFDSDAADEEKVEISEWFGIAQTSGPSVTPYTYEDTRVDMISADLGYVDIENLPDTQNGQTYEDLGKVEVLLNRANDLKLKVDDGNFRIDPTRPIQAFNNNGDITLNDIKANKADLYAKGDPDTDHTVKIRVPVQFSPLAKGTHVDTVLVDFVITPTRTVTVETGIVTGKGFIPEISISNYKFDPTGINEGISPEKGEIIITNISDPADGEKDDLVVQSIVPEGPNANLFQNFEVDGVPMANFTGQNLDDKDDFIRVTFDLNTDGATAGQKLARLNVLSDAGPGDNGNTPVTENTLNQQFDGDYAWDNSTALDDGGYIQAPLSSSGVEAIGEDLGDRSRCFLVPGTVTVENKAGGTDPEPITVIGIEYAGNPAEALNAYEFNGFQNLVIQPGEIESFTAEFKPGTPEGVYDGAVYNVIFSVDTISASFTMSGEVIEDEFELSLSEHKNLIPGDEFDMEVNFEALNETEYETAQLSTMYVTLRYRPEWLSFTGDVNNGDILNWNISDATTTQQINGINYTFHTFTLEAPANEIITRGGLLFSPKFTYLLHPAPEGQDSDSISIEPIISNVRFENVNGVDRTECVTTELLPGVITSEFCIQNFRAVDVFLAGGTSLKAISPNPVVGSMNLDFTVSSDAQVQIDMTNTEGKKVKSLINSKLNAGVYETTADVSDLPAGVYLVHFRYLGVDHTQKVIITK